MSIVWIERKAAHTWCRFPVLLSPLWTFFLFFWKMYIYNTNITQWRYYATSNWQANNSKDTSLCLHRSTFMYVNNYKYIKYHVKKRVFHKPVKNRALFLTSDRLPKLWKSQWCNFSQDALLQSKNKCPIISILSTDNCYRNGRGLSARHPLSCHLTINTPGCDSHMLTFHLCQELVAAVWLSLSKFRGCVIWQLNLALRASVDEWLLSTQPQETPEMGNPEKNPTQKVHLEMGNPEKVLLPV